MTDNDARKLLAIVRVAIRELLTAEGVAVANRSN